MTSSNTDIASALSPLPLALICLVALTVASAPFLSLRYIWPQQKHVLDRVPVPEHEQPDVLETERDDESLTEVYTDLLQAPKPVDAMSATEDTAPESVSGDGVGAVLEKTKRSKERRRRGRDVAKETRGGTKSSLKARVTARSTPTVAKDRQLEPNKGNSKGNKHPTIKITPHEAATPLSARNRFRPMSETEASESTNRSHGSDGHDGINPSYPVLTKEHESSTSDAPTFVTTESSPTTPHIPSRSQPHPQDDSDSKTPISQATSTILSTPPSNKDQSFTQTQSPEPTPPSKSPSTSPQCPSPSESVTTRTTTSASTLSTPQSIPASKSLPMPSLNNFQSSEDESRSPGYTGRREGVSWPSQSETVIVPPSPMWSTDVNWGGPIKSSESSSVISDERFVPRLSTSAPRRQDSPLSSPEMPSFPTLNTPPPAKDTGVALATQVAALRGALEAARLREDKHSADMQAQAKELEALRWRWMTDCDAFRRREMELQTHINTLVQMFHSQGQPLPMMVPSSGPAHHTPLHFASPISSNASSPLLRPMEITSPQMYRPPSVPGMSLSPPPPFSPLHPMHSMGVSHFGPTRPNLSRSASPLIHTVPGNSSRSSQRNSVYVSDIDGADDRPFDVPHHLASAILKRPTALSRSSSVSDADAQSVESSSDRYDASSERADTDTTPGNDSLTGDPTMFDDDDAMRTGEDREEKI